MSKVKRRSNRKAPAADTTAARHSRRRGLIDAIKSSPNYLRAYEDLDFLHRDELRPIRLQLELLKPEMILSSHNIHSTLICFGSARIGPPQEAAAQVKVLEAAVKKHPQDKDLRRRLRVAQNLLAQSRYYEEARKFGSIVTKAAQADAHREFVIVTGGGPGVMEAANRGAFEAGGKSIGLNITLPHEQDPNPYITPDLCFQFHYFALRKMHFLMRARGLVVFPGGFGTMDELFETLTLVQTGKKRRFPIILFGREFWSNVVDFQYLADCGVIADSDLDLFQYVETAQEAWEKIQEYWQKHGFTE
ncbi:MAG: TIGR00730 family Rossman fold protein [Elusimicrobia bacterium]|nr:TIGR00730 family Rossman fold protein [Elusimicrobiota bacterium]